jgi:hypothetical protein
MNHHAPSPEEAVALIDHAVRAVGERDALAILGVHRTTLMRWRAGKVRIPHAALALLRIWHEGRLPGMTDHWQGFHFFGDKLYTAAGVGYSAREIDYWHWKYQECEYTQRRNAQLEALVRDLSAKLDATHGAANEGLTYTDLANPPRRPKRVNMG